MQNIGYSCPIPYIHSIRVAATYSVFCFVYSLTLLSYLWFIFLGTGIPLAVQLESLRSFLFLCSQSDESLLVQLLAEFPSLLVPLSSDIQVKVENGVTFSGNC
ncbi:uncharacterized protein LOC124944422 [Impatiens glandulifera]|uniref:uncharacterized protein LOC124944422 n=1 Tax=Impatiens glandulifera TaxID=253017 RepID=UPI001FB0AC39|nr:uncharacterized protein LOC124944422 [Impatiens glandulifera]